jgi:phosphatidylserine/phosphatidylglycerophosphate/cardiolipin synthase-like enzyme
MVEEKEKRMFKIATAEAGTIHDLAAKLAQQRPQDKGAFYELTEGNVFCENGLIATPGDSWGRSVMGENHGHEFVDALYSIITSAQHSVDILTLAPFADGEFKNAIRNALTRLSATGRTVTVRIVFGQPSPLPNLGTEDFLKDITAGTTRNVKVYVAQFTPKNAPNYYSWNHAKIVAADGNVAMVGGHNFYNDAYLSRTSPIFDLSMKLEGPAAASAHKFADRIWQYIKANNHHGGVFHKTYSNSYAGGVYGQLAAEPFALSAAPGQGDVPVLGVAMPGFGFSADESEILASEKAMVYFIENAKHSVYISQQDLIKSGAMGDAAYNKAIFGALIKFVLQRKGMLGIVVSTPYAKAGGGSYSDNFHPEKILEALLYAAAEAKIPVNDAVHDELQQRVFIGTVRFSHADAAWPGPNPIGNHAKFWMVDERVFYIGSHNMYPTVWLFSTVNRTSLQEYGFVVDHAPSAKRVLQSYWRPLVEYSLNSAISGICWGVGPESLYRYKRPTDLPVPARRIGPLLDDGAGTMRLFSLSGSGELMVRTLDNETQQWNVTDIAAPPEKKVTLAGPAIPQQQSAVVATKDGNVYERRFDKTAKQWTWTAHGKPGASPVQTFGPLWTHPGYGHPYRFFLATQDGILYDRYWMEKEQKWDWQAHVRADGKKITAIGPVFYDTAYPEPAKLFVLREDGNVDQRQWNPKSGWDWRAHGNPGSPVTAISGTMIADRGTVHPIKVYTIAGGALWELFYERGSTWWQWLHHPAPSGRTIKAIGPSFLHHSYGDEVAKVFVVTDDGALWERYWSQKRDRWEWRDHGLAGGTFRIAGIGPNPPFNAEVMGPLRIFVTTEQGRFFERRWNRKDGDWIWSTQWQRDDIPAAPQRIGELAGNTLYTASGSGHVIVRTDDRVTAELAPPNDVVTALGPAISGDRQMVFFRTSDDLMHAQWSAASKSWSFVSHGKPHGSRIAALGPMLHHASYVHPYRFFVAAENGNLYDRYTDAGFSNWSWQDHGQPSAGRVRSIGPVVHDPYNEYVYRVFVGGGDGNVHERRWKDGMGWNWNPPISAGVFVEQVGPWLQEEPEDRRVVRLFLLLANGQIYERNWRAASGWMWSNHEHPAGARVAAIGPGFVQNDRTRLFVRTVSGELWERRCERGIRPWTWIKHALPDAKQRVAAIGPRTLNRPSTYVTTPRVYIATADGALHERRWISGDTWEWIAAAN